MSELTERLRAYDKIENPLADGPAVRGWNHMVRNQQEAANALEAQEARLSDLTQSLEWALAEIEGRTSYQEEGQYDRCMERAIATWEAENRLTLSKAPSIK